MTTTALKAINGGSKQRNERKLASEDKSRFIITLICLNQQCD
ncbi:MAG: hypothetical protein V7L11_19400 [Nostoc sp.]